MTDLPPEFSSYAKESLLKFFQTEFGNFGQVEEVTPATSMLCVFIRFASAAQVTGLLNALIHSDHRNDPHRQEFFFRLRSGHCVKISRAHTNTFRSVTKSTSSAVVARAESPQGSFHRSGASRTVDFSNNGFESGHYASPKLQSKQSNNSSTFQSVKVDCVIQKESSF